MIRKKTIFKQTADENTETSPARQLVVKSIFGTTKERTKFQEMLTIPLQPPNFVSLYHIFAEKENFAQMDVRKGDEAIVFIPIAENAVLNRIGKMAKDSQSNCTYPSNQVSRRRGLPFHVCGHHQELSRIYHLGLWHYEILSIMWSI